MSEDGLKDKSGGLRQRLLDNAAFFHAVQNAFYTKFVKAIRATGWILTSDQIDAVLRSLREREPLLDCVAS